MNMDFQSHFSYDSDHNVATKFANMKGFIHWMYDNNLFIKYVIIYDTTYGCRKKYRCANAMWLLSVLGFTYRVIIDIWINDTGNGKRKIDDINEDDKI